MSELIFSIMMAGAILWLVIVGGKKGKVWRPRDPKAVSLIKVACWAGLVTWMVFTLATSIVVARLAPVYILQLLGSDTRGQILSWVVPIWIVFTTLVLIWAVARFANNRLRRKEEIEKPTKT